MEPTPSLSEFLALYREDDNEWWRLGSGDHQNLFDDAIERIAELEEQLRLLERLTPGDKHVPWGDVTWSDHNSGQRS